MDQPDRRILIVETDIELRTEVLETLGAAGFVCHPVDTGQKAMDLLGTTRYDLVLANLRVRHGEGRSFCLDLLEQTDHPPTIVITDQEQPGIAEALRGRGAAEIRNKPVDCGALSATVRELLAGGTPPVEPSEDDRPAEESTAPAGGDAQNDAPPDTISSQAKRIVTILLKDAERRQDLVQKLTAGGEIEAVTAAGSEDLYQCLNKQRVDLVIIENELEGFLTGVEILGRLYNDLIRPEAILLAEKNEQLDRKTRELGIRTVVSPRAEVDEIVKLVENLCSDSSNRSEIIPTRPRKLIQQFDGIPPLPHLMIKLIGYMKMQVEEIPMKDLANDISFDPKAITELLRLTNSSAMGLGRKVNNVADAVALLGPKRTISLIFASSTVKTQAQLLKGWSDGLRRWYHQRSILIASTASIFAQKLEKVSPDTAFILGLVQELGILVMARSIGDAYTQNLQRTLDVGQLQLPLMEEKEYRMTHAEVSAALLQKWKFPQSMIGPVLEHHNLDTGVARSGVEKSFLRAMRIGEAVANLSDRPHAYRCQALNRLLGHYGEDQVQTCRECIEESIAKTADSCKLLKLPIPDEETMDKLFRTIAASDEFAEEPQRA